jgi:hypothetical protein
MALDNQSFDLVRIGRAKKAVDISDVTIRAWAARGWLHIYKVGKASFFSKSELESVIRNHNLKAQLPNAA